MNHLDAQFLKSSEKQSITETDAQLPKSSEKQSITETDSINEDQPRKPNAPAIQETKNPKRTREPSPPFATGFIDPALEGRYGGGLRRPNRTPNYSKDAEQMSVESQKLNQGQPILWVPPPPPDPPNPHRK